MTTTHLPCGIEIPQVFFDGPADMEHIRKFVTEAETLGYDSLWLQERIIGDIIMLEPVTLLSYVAAITTKFVWGFRLSCCHYEILYNWRKPTRHWMS